MACASSSMRPVLSSEPVFIVRRTRSAGLRAAMHRPVGHGPEPAGLGVGSRMSSYPSLARSRNGTEGAVHPSDRLDWVRYSNLAEIGPWQHGVRHASASRCRRLLMLCNAFRVSVSFHHRPRLKPSRGSSSNRCTSKANELLSATRETCHAQTASERYRQLDTSSRFDCATLLLIPPLAIV